MRLLFCLFLVALHFSCISQIKYDYNWMYGGGGGTIDHPDGNFAISFNTDSVSFIRNASELRIKTANATMSDANGHLTFYTNGCSIFNSNHSLMENGDSINPGFIYDNYCAMGLPYPFIQSMITLPVPNKPSHYMLIHKTGYLAEYDYIPYVDVFTSHLRYTTIDMEANNGLGKVIGKEIIWGNDTIDVGNLSATKHTNGEDWWILVSRYWTQSDYYRAFLFTEDGIVDTVEQVIGDTTYWLGSGSGQASFSPDGSLYVRNNNTDGVYLYDFDRSTGLLSNFRKLSVTETGELGGTGGHAISSNNRFLYVASFPYVYQFDLWEEDTEAIQASRVLVAEYDGFTAPFPTNFFLMQLGPDCRIYIGSTNGVKFLHVIANPNEKGEACNFYQHGLELPVAHSISMPTFPHYRMDSNEPLCDSTIQVPITISPVDAVEWLEDIEEEGLSVFPNPSYGEVTIEWKTNIRATKGYLHDARGRIMKQFEVVGATQRLDVQQVPKGLYVLHFVDEKTGRRWSKRLIIQ